MKLAVGKARLLHRSLIGCGPSSEGVGGIASHLERGRARQLDEPNGFRPLAEISQPAERDGADPVADTARKQERASVGFAAIKALLEG